MSSGLKYRGFASLELLLVIAILAVLFQLFPSLWFSLAWAVDFRNWSRGGWLVANIVVVVALCAVRFRPELKRAFTAIGSFADGVLSARPSAGRDASADDDLEARTRRAAEWRERAKNRMPWT